MALPKSSITSDLISIYLNETSSTTRSRLLRDLATNAQTIPVQLVDDLALIDLPLAEKNYLIRLCDKNDPLAFEDVMTRGVLNWDPNIAATAIREWVKFSNHLLWWRYEEVTKNNPSQRVIYTLLDSLNYVGGETTLHQISHNLEMTEASEATLSLLYLCATLWSYNSKKLVHYAEKHLVNSIYNNSTSSTIIPHLLSYLARISPESLDNLVINPIKSKLWQDNISSYRSMLDVAKNSEKKLKTVLKSSRLDDEEFFRTLLDLWPPSYTRHHLSSDIFLSVAEELKNRPHPFELTPPPVANISFDFFGGFGEKFFLTALKKASPEVIQYLLPHIFCYFSEEGKKKLKPLIPDNLQLSERIKADLDMTPGSSSRLIQKALAFNPIDGDDAQTPRQRYLQSVYTSRKIPPKDNEDSWSILHQAYLEPSHADRTTIKNVARKVDQVFATAIFRLVEKFSGCDDMIPLVLDHLNSEDQDTLLAISRALVGIGTNTALGHFVKILSNSSIPTPVRLEMCGLVTAEHMTKYQPELREIVESVRRQDIKLKALDLELIENLRELMSSNPQPSITTKNTLTITEHNPHDIDQELRKKLPGFDDLHQESKRAFRTAFIFQSTIHGVAQGGQVDISPVVDLQFKGLEILFRKKFEGSVYHIVQDARRPLQRKLDALGYLRPSPDAMNAFENYISSLPVVRDIPQFSRYKLNRVLKAIANFRAGRRFTVEGIKGYAFIFLTFGRKECRHGLENMIPLNTKSDEELAHFCRDLHIYQDIRNQAVHEGLPPHMVSNIDGYWNLTASILSRITDLTT